MKGCQCKKGCQCERVAYSKLPRPNIQLNCRHCRSCLILPAASNPRFLKQTFSLTAKIHGFFYSCLPANFQTLILPLVFVCPTSDTNSSSCAFVHWHEMFCSIVRMQDFVRADWQGDLQLPLQPNSHPLTVFPSLHHDLSSPPMISQMFWRMYLYILIHTYTYLYILISVCSKPKWATSFHRDSHHCHCPSIALFFRSLSPSLR